MSYKKGLHSLLLKVIEQNCHVAVSKYGVGWQIQTFLGSFVGILLLGRKGTDWGRDD